MQGKLLLAVGLAVGYVLGTRRGREGFDNLKKQASNTWRNPNVQRTVSSAQKFAQDNIPVVGDAISDAVDKVNDAASAASGTRSTSTGTPSTGTSTGTGASSSTGSAPGNA